MGRTSNKKRQHHDRDTRRSNDFGLSDSLHAIKRRRLSDDSTAQEHHQKLRSISTNGADDHDGWQTVPVKSNSRQKKQQQRNNYPHVFFEHKVHRPVKIEQFRDLVLYVLADAIAPDWVAIRNARQINKVVVMMVPGLDSSALERARELMKKIRVLSKRMSATEKANEKENGKAANGSTGALNDKPGESAEQGLKGEAVASITAREPANEVLKQLNNTEVNENDMTSFLDLLQEDLDQWLFDETIPVMAPGDSKYSRVHSPLQAVLVAPETTNRASSKQPPEKTFKAVLTPIMDFVHTADELRDAEYPIHPAAFESAQDAALEASRRERTGQSKAGGWVDTDVKESRPSIPEASSTTRSDAITQGLTIFSVDCEMVLTSDQQSSLARISVVAWPDGKVVMDRFVTPDLPIENYFTQYSGITPQILENVTTRLSDIQTNLLKIFTPSTILLGHSLESDLNAMRLTHPYIVDTSMLYPHPRGLPLRSSLKFLANKYLKREIQTGGADGHNSVEDARAVLDLVKLKCEKGPKFGTPEANGESIFKRLARHKRINGKTITSAIVEYGSSPERGLGAGATHAIGCQNDDEVAAGLIRAIQGDSDGEEIPAGGLDFIWGRLRALEYVRGWVTNTKSNTDASTVVASGVENDSRTNGNLIKPEESKQTQDEVDRTILRTLQHIVRIRSSLPPTTLFILLSGPSDIRPVTKLQAIQAQYRKEFKVKKWDELSVKWTDTEEQALRNAAERARMGWGYLSVV